MTFSRAELEAAYAERIGLYGRANQELVRITSELVDDLSGAYGFKNQLTISGEPKAVDSLWKKTQTGKWKDICVEIDDVFEKIGDIARAKAICPTIDDCQQLLELLKSQDALYVDDSLVQDRLFTPSPTGYRGLHLTVGVTVQFRGVARSINCELQIRSILQEAWSYYTHDDFYKGLGANAVFQSMMKDLSDLLHYADKQAALIMKEVSS